MLDALPTGPRGRILALALLGLALGVVYVCVGVPLRTLYVERQTLLDDRRLLASKLAAAAAQMPALREQADALRADGGDNRLTLDGASDAIAAAALQGRTEELANASGVTISSGESLPADAHDAFRRIGIRLAVSGSYATLVRFIAALEAAEPPLLIDNSRLAGGLAAVTPGGAAPLLASLEIYGFRAASGTEAADPPGAVHKDTP